LIYNNHHSTELQDTINEKHISTTPLRYRAVKDALDVEENALGSTHKLEYNSEGLNSPAAKHPVEEPEIV
jgi:hypothetical protein